MSLLSKNGCQYADGGFGDLNPILCHRKMEPARSMLLFLRRKIESEIT
jgi:hypothetical protein